MFNLNFSVRRSALVLAGSLSLTTGTINIAPSSAIAQQAPAPTTVTTTDNSQRTAPQSVIGNPQDNNGNGSGKCPVGYRAVQSAAKTGQFSNHTDAASTADKNNLSTNGNPSEANGLGFCELNNTNEQDQNQQLHNRGGDQQNTLNVGEGALSPESHAKAMAKGGYSSNRIETELLQKFNGQIDAKQANEIAIKAFNDNASRAIIGEGAGAAKTFVNTGGNTTEVRSVNLGDQEATKSVALPTGNATCILTMGQISTASSMPMQNDAKVSNLTLAADVSGGGVAGKVSLGGARSSSKGGNREDAIETVKPCREQQKVQTSLLEMAIKTGNTDLLRAIMFQPNGGTVNNVNAGAAALQQQQQGQLQQQGSQTEPNETAWK